MNIIIDHVDCNYQECLILTLGAENIGCLGEVVIFKGNQEIESNWKDSTCCN